ncbi:PREDICTED: fasciclin-like arabinogalactan protein 1 [Nelumbo nucifera]|uniref:FAS1 domain-containing protein n=2 Tax=Nelumbo nucifera TaxID=4432 RepID=A0A822XTD5_NELNU|nr:PREDICTED: fasciclin-like arabinogalactan protein 1 [Nelumbo nucifera]DAD23660.1 TPA_asm: hypothetical protein HUJ06_025124 [Nelumbo nucifera]
MQLFPAATGTIALSLLLLLAGVTDAHNITSILAKNPDFSIFNQFLTLTHLAVEINQRETITICTVDNGGMSDLLSKQLSIYTIKNVLSLHVLLDYFGAQKLHQITNGTALTATMFQATGSAPGSSGFVNITDLKGGKVGFGAESNHGNLDATFVKSVEEIPYNISVIQISKIMASAEAEAPTPGPSQLNLTSLMSKQGCKVFADTLVASGAEQTFDDNIVGGLTVFCPTDQAFKDFMPKYKNLTADGKNSLLLYHGIPVYYSMPMLKSNNGVVNTLATDGANNYDFTIQNDGELVTLETKIVTAKITGTLLDKQPVAIYTIDKVLVPKELVKASPTPTPAPAPAPKVAKSSKAPTKHAPPPPQVPESMSPEPMSPDGEPADQTVADDNGGVRFNGARWTVAVLSVLLLTLLI